MEPLNYSETKLYETNKYRCLTSRQKQTDDIYLTMCGVETCLPDYRFHAENRSGYHLHVILSGKGVLCVDGRSRELHFGQMFITKPGEDTWYKADSTDPWAYCWMTYDGNNAARYTESAGFRDGINVLDCNVDAHRFYEIVKRVLDHPELTLANDLLRMGLMMEFISLAVESNYKFSKEIHHEHAYPTDVYVDYAVNYIQSNYATARVTDVARFIGIHRSYLTGIFKKKLGISPQEYLMQCKLKKASELLLETRLPIQEISQQVGYDNPLTFSKIFKSFYGVSPKNYRLQFRAPANTDEKESNQ